MRVQRSRDELQSCKSDFVDPEWLLNERRQPEMAVQVGARRISILARAVASTDEPTLWTELVNDYGDWGDFQKLTDRTNSFIELVLTPHETKSSSNARDDHVEHGIDERLIRCMFIGHDDSVH